VQEISVSFLYFEGCPLAPRARDNLFNALMRVSLGIQVEVEYVNLTARDTPEHLKCWGSPTILINDLEVTGGKRGAASSCRIYNRDGRVPTADEIVGSIIAALNEKPRVERLKTGTG
jgi:hypothetical protein